MLHLLMFAAGLAALVIGANLLVRGASQMALALGISPLVVGLTIVAFGTSAPEMAVSAGAVLDGTTDLAVGNVVGSNIFNILFVLGSSAVIAPLVVNMQLIRQEVPVLVAASLLLLLLGLDGSVGMTDGALLLGALLTYTFFLVVQSRRAARAAAEASAAETECDLGITRAPAGSWHSALGVQLLLILIGLALLVVGSDWLVAASVAFATALGVSQVVIGLTIVAAGTSMPEVATSIAATLRGERDIAVGNAVGSSTFNILGCLGLSGLLSGNTGLALTPSLVAFDLWVMLAVTLAAFPIFLSGREIARWEGGLFLAYYAAYVAYLIMAAQEHAALPAYSAAMLSFVIPLTLVTVVASVIRRRETPSA